MIIFRIYTFISIQHQGPVKIGIPLHPMVCIQTWHSGVPLAHRTWWNSKGQIAATAKFQFGPGRRIWISPWKLTRSGRRLNFWIQHTELYAIPSNQNFPIIIEWAKTRTLRSDPSLLWAEPPCYGTGRVWFFTHKLIAGPYAQGPPCGNLHR